MWQKLRINTFMSIAVSSICSHIVEHVPERACGLVPQPYLIALSNDNDKTPIRDTGLGTSNLDHELVRLKATTRVPRWRYDVRRLLKWLLNRRCQARAWSCKREEA